MAGRLILPPQYMETIDAPLIFLAGPIVGASDWQEKAIRIIGAEASELYIASPRRRVDERYSKGDFTTGMYNEQVDWETYHIRKAGENGAIMFWLAKEFEHIRGRAYAQTSRFELGEWKVRHERDGINLVIGIEAGFTGARYVKRRLAQDCPDVRLFSTLEETCTEAIRMAR